MSFINSSLNASVHVLRTFVMRLIEEQGQKVPDVAGQYNVGKSTLEPVHD